MAESILYFLLLYFFRSMTEAGPDDPFHPAEQDIVHFGTLVLNFDRPRHSASTRKGSIRLARCKQSYEVDTVLREVFGAPAQAFHFLAALAEINFEMLVKN